MDKHQLIKIYLRGMVTDFGRGRWEMREKDWLAWLPHMWNSTISPSCKG